MRGVILAGGTGSRLYPLTKATNKHLLPIGDRPMIEWPLRTMVAAGVHEIVVVMGGEHFQAISRALGDGSDYGADLVYAVQEKPAGIADALMRAKAFVDGDSSLVILGDNVFLDATPIREMAQWFDTGMIADQYRLRPDWLPTGCVLFLYKTKSYSAYGVAVLDDTGRVVEIVEKPQGLSGHQHIVTGAYIYTPDVFDRISDLKPSARRELEVSDLNRTYLADGEIWTSVVAGWFDCGESIEHYHHVNRRFTRQAKEQFA